MKKLIYILLYFLITKIIPIIGTTSFFFDPDYKWIQTLSFSIIGIIFFGSELKHSFETITPKKTLFFSIIPSLIIVAFYTIFLFLINNQILFEMRYSLSFILIINYVILTPFVEELVYRYCFLSLSSKKKINLFFL